MNLDTQYVIRHLFQNKILKADGQEFENIFGTIIEEKIIHFCLGSGAKNICPFQNN